MRGLRSPKLRDWERQGLDIWELWRGSYRVFRVQSAPDSRHAHLAQVAKPCSLSQTWNLGLLISANPLKFPA